MPMLLLISNAITLRWDKSILYIRATIKSLILISITAFNNLNKSLGNVIGVYNTIANTVNSKLIHNIKLCLIKCKINTSFFHICKLITHSIIIKVVILFLCYTLNFVGLPYDMVYKFVSMAIILILTVTFIVTDNKLAFIYNLGIIIIFWLLFGYTVNYFSHASINFNNLFFDFLANYYHDHIQPVNSGIPQDMQDHLNSVLLYLNDNLSSIYNGGPSNGGPNGTPPSMLYYDFDSLDDEDKQYCRYAKIIDKINNFYSKSMWELDKRYYDQVKCKNFINTYNNSLDYNKTNKHIIILNTIVDYDLRFEHAHYLQTWMPNTDMYKLTIAMYNMLLWENDVLDKIKFLCDNKDSPIRSDPKHVSCHNYWLNRQLPYNVLGTLRLNIPIPDFTDEATFYREVCEDLLWVKLQLLLVNTFIINYVPFDSKSHDIECIMRELIGSNLLKFKEGYECLSELRKLDLRESSGYAIDFFSQFYPSDLFSLWDEVNVWKKLGLGLSYKFGYPEFDYMTKLKNHVNLDYHDDVSSNQDQIAQQENPNIRFKFPFDTLYKHLYKGGKIYHFSLSDYSYQTVNVKHLGATEVGLGITHKYAYPGLLDNYYKLSHNNGHIKSTSTLGLNLVHKFSNKQLVFK